MSGSGDLSLFILGNMKPKRKIKSRREERSRLKGRKEIKRDKFGQHLLLFDVGKLSKGNTVVCPAASEEA